MGHSRALPHIVCGRRRPRSGRGRILLQRPLTWTRAGEIITAIPPRPILALISSRWCKPYFALNASTGGEGLQIAMKAAVRVPGNGAGVSTVVVIVGLR